VSFGCTLRRRCGGGHKIEIRGPRSGGNFERIIGRAFYAVDPQSARQSGHYRHFLRTDKQRRQKSSSPETSCCCAPRRLPNTRPVFLEVVNRGGPQANYLMMGARTGDPLPEHWDLGDRFPLEQGFTMAFVGCSSM